MNSYKYIHNDKEIKHGSLVIATIQKYCSKEIGYYIFDIYNTKKQAKSVLKSLFQCLWKNIDIIVMSFTLSTHKYRKRIEFLLFLLYIKGVTIVAANNNKQEEKSFPASCKYVIGTGNDILSYSNCVQIRGDVKPEFVKVGNKYHLFSGTSKVNAVATAEILNSNMFHFSNNFDLKKENRKQSKQHVINQFTEEVYLKNLKLCGINENMYLFDGKHNMEEIETIIINLLKEYDLVDSCLVMQYNDMTSIRDISFFIGEYLDEKKQENI